MSSWAVIKTQGKQYKVQEGDKIAIENLKNAKDKITFSEVLMLKTEKGIKVGKPYVDKAQVTGKFLEHFKGKKIRVVKFKSKSRYTRTTGYRDQKTLVLIEKIES